MRTSLLRFSYTMRLSGRHRGNSLLSLPFQRWQSMTYLQFRGRSSCQFQHYPEIAKVIQTIMQVVVRKRWLLNVITRVGTSKCAGTKTPFISAASAIIFRASVYFFLTISHRMDSGTTLDVHSNLSNEIKHYSNAVIFQLAKLSIMHTNNMTRR